MKKTICILALFIGYGCQAIGSFRSLAVLAHHMQSARSRGQRARGLASLLTKYEGDDWKERIDWEAFRRASATAHTLKCLSDLSNEQVHAYVGILDLGQADTFDWPGNAESIMKLVGPEDAFVFERLCTCNSAEVQRILHPGDVSVFDQSKVQQRLLNTGSTQAFFLRFSFPPFQER